MPAPTTLPVWATDQQALIVTPSLAKQQQGWTTDTNTPQGQGEKPPLQFFNWYQNLVYQWIQYLSQAVGNLPAFGTIATQNANDVTISGGNITDTNFGGGQIDSTPIGLNTPEAAAFTKAIDNGVAPTLPTQLTNKAYVDATAAGTKTVNSNGTCLQLPGGLKIQIIPVTFPASNNDIVQANVTFPVPFTSIDYFAIPSGTQPLNSSSAPSTGSGIPVVRDTTLTGLTAILDTNGYLTHIDNTTTGTILAIGF